MADETGQKRTVKRLSIGPKPVRVLTVTIRATGDDVEALFDSGDAPHPRMVDQLTDLAREAWLNLHLKSMGETGRFEFLVVPPKPATKFPARMWGQFAQHARRSIERVMTGESSHETLSMPHAFSGWNITFERANINDVVEKQQDITSKKEAADESGSLDRLKFPKQPASVDQLKRLQLDIIRLNERMTEALEPFVGEFEEVLSRATFGVSPDLKVNQQTADACNYIARRMERGFVCPREANPKDGSAGEDIAATLRCYSAPGVPEGVISFEHPKKDGHGRPHGHGGFTEWARLTLTNLRKSLEAIFR